MEVPTTSGWDARGGRLATGGIAVLVLAKLGLHVATAGRYGYFRDELYYLASTNHLGFGYVEHPPLSIAILAVVRALVGDSLWALRAVPALAGAGQMLVTAALVGRLGGGTTARFMAALCVLVAPNYLGTHHIYSMNALDHFAWALCTLLVVRALQDGGTRRWVAVGVAFGLALENKLSVLWLLGGLVAGILLGPQRRVLRTRGPYVAALIAAAIAAPYFIWQQVQGWPLLEFMRNAAEHKMVRMPPLAFLREQFLEMQPAAAPVWILGLVAALRRPDWRCLGIAWLVVLAILLANGTSRPSYLSPAYPMLFAIGAIAIENGLRRLRATRRRLATTLHAALVVLLLTGGAVVLPFALPVLAPETFVRYSSALGLRPAQQETTRVGLLPQHFADQFGWPELAATVASVYQALPPDERARCRVFGQNYGEAGAIDVLGRKLGLPPALSGHNSYWLWGTRGAADVYIVIGSTFEDNSEFFESVEQAAVHTSPYSMPYESDLPIFVCRRPKAALASAWPQLRMYI